MKKLIIIVIFFVSNFLIAQNPGSYYNPKDDQYRLLGLKRSKEAFESAKVDFDRQKALYEKKMISDADYQRAKTVFSDAEVNYQQALLAVILKNNMCLLLKL